MSNADETRYLRALQYRFANAEEALAECAHLRSVLALPVGTVHVVSDVHGEHRKLEHILRNGSGSLRPLVERLFASSLGPDARNELLSLVYYPREQWGRIRARLGSGAEPALRETVARLFELLASLASRYTLRHTRRALPAGYEELFQELLQAALLRRDRAYIDALLEPYFGDDGGLALVRSVAHTLRALVVHELIVAGDLGDRGPRIDRVIAALRRQRSVRIVWGNHDAEWMGACLGQPALVATVLRVSLRYGRLAQLEEGYGIPVEPVEQLARAAYGDDPAERFHPKGEDLRDPLLLSRMQKAMAVLQWKLEAHTLARNPEFAMRSRALLERVDPAQGTVTLDGAAHPLLDRSFPTVDWADPSKLSEHEQRCIDALVRSFRESASLWADMSFVLENGSMYALRDDAVIFHGCVPCDEDGSFREVPVDGARARGRGLFDAYDRVIRRAFRTREMRDLDALYYLWAGPDSPLFGKDRMATFETYLVADKKTHAEKKNPYFKLIHERPFCESVAREFGADPARALIVNGHVPVKLEAGEKPLKNSGMAVTIDGAFSEAYGDRGYTLVLSSERASLAQHHHFESVEAVLDGGGDIVPELTDLRVYDRPRTVGDTARGAELRQEIASIERLVRAYRDGELAARG